MEYQTTRKVAVIDLTTKEGPNQLQEILNLEGVVCDPTKDVEYFFGDRSQTLVAVVYYTIIVGKVPERKKTPKELITEPSAHE